MSNQFLFQIFMPLCKGTLQTQLADIELQFDLWLERSTLSADGLLQTRIYLSDAANQLDEVKNSSLYVDLLSRGAVSYIEQPPLNGSKIAIQICFSSSPHVIKRGVPGCMEVEVDGVHLFFHSVRFSADEVRGTDAAEQTKMAFKRHIQWLDENGLTLEKNCQRTWIYVRDIDRHYAGVVLGRNQIFSQHGLTADTHFIASTGIGGYSDNREAIVSVDFLSIKVDAELKVKYLSALDFLNPTHEYGVAFERGTQLQLPQGSLSFISGTASIDKHGECLHRGDVLTQAGRLFLNIEKLLNDGGSTLSDVKYMIVYLRDITDYESVSAYLALRFPKIPRIITEARVCRPEWLIEVECVAIDS